MAGTGTSKSRPGEADFVATYRKRFRFPRPSVTADVVAVSPGAAGLSVLLIERGHHPFQGCWAIPGGFVDVGDAFEDHGEDLPDAAARELEEETGVPRGAAKLFPIGAFGRPHRDPRIRTVTIAWLALLTPAQAAKVQADDDAARAEWVPIERLGRLRLAFDHDEVMAAALGSLARRLEDSDILAPLLPASFTRAQLRQAYESVAGRAATRARFAISFRRLREDAVLTVSGTRFRFRRPHRVPR